MDDINFPNVPEEFVQCEVKEEPLEPYDSLENELKTVEETFDENDSHQLVGSQSIKICDVDEEVSEEQLELPLNDLNVFVDNHGDENDPDWDQDWEPSKTNNKKHKLLNQNYKSSKLTKLENNGEDKQRVKKIPKKIKCKFCEFCGPSGDLKRHLEQVHEKKKQFRCEICSKDFFRKQHMRDHIAAVHEGKKPFKCENCGTNFAKAFQLKSHIVSVHEGRKPYSCDTCNDKFSSKHGLQYHVTVKHILKGYVIQKLAALWIKCSLGRLWIESWLLESSLKV